jgi:hypothetical protein
MQQVWVNVAHNLSLSCGAILQAKTPRH